MKYMLALFQLFAYYISNVAAGYCGLPYCLNYYDGCNSCGCTTHNGLAMCTLRYCDITFTTAAYCTTCDHDMYWLKFGANCGSYHSCDSRYIGAPCMVESMSTCACPSGYYLETATDNTTACIAEENCPSMGQPLDTITDDMVFKYPTDERSACGYTYKICTHDSECDTDFYCDKQEEDTFYDSDCVPLHCYLDSDCEPYNCLSDCVGIGYGTCVPLLEETTTTAQPANTDWDAIMVQLKAQMDIWNGHNIAQYVYSAQHSCFCLPCYWMKKFITVQDDEALDIVFEHNTHNCTASSLTQYDHNTVNDWFNTAYAYAEEKGTQCGTNAVTSGSSVGWDPCRDTSLDVEYDETYGYPTKIIFDVEAMAYDGGSLWKFECLDVYHGGELVSTATCDFTATYTTTYATTDVDRTDVTVTKPCECEDGSIVERDANTDCELECRGGNPNESNIVCYEFGVMFVIAMLFLVK